MRGPLSGWLLWRVLRRASSPEQAGFAAAILPLLDGAVPPSASGARFARSLCSDEQWAARYVAARSLPRLTPEFLSLEEAWRLLLGLAADPVRSVREGAAIGLSMLATRCPEATSLLEQLITDPAGASAERKAALRSLILLALDPSAAERAEELLRAAAHAGGWVTAGVGPVIIRRGIGGRDPKRAAEIVRRWLDSDDPVLQEQANRCLVPGIEKGRT